MSRNGTGTYSLPAGNPVTTGTTISSTTHNNTMADVASAITESIARDGQTTPTANLPMGGFKHTNVADATARTDYGKVSQIQDGGYMMLSSVAGADTITASITPSITAYASGQFFTFIAAGANTGAVTLNINSIGAKAVTKEGTTALAAGDIASGAVVNVVYDGTRFQIVSGRSVQPLDATLTALAGLSTGADKIAYSTGTDTFSETTLSSFARTVIDDTSGSAVYATLGAAQSLAANGYQTFPSGLTMQWGSALTNASGVATFTFPVAFSTALFSSQVTYRAGSLVGDRFLNVAVGTTTSVAAYLSNSAGTAVSGAAIHFFVIGN